MNGYNFTNETRRALAAAREAAVRQGLEYVDSHHILLGLIAEPANLATRTLAALGVDAEALRSAMDAAVPPATRRTGPDLPYTVRAKHVLEFSMSEAHQLGHQHVGTGHLLLGVLREPKGHGGQYFAAAGIDVDRARAVFLKLMGEGVTESGAGVDAAPPSLQSKLAAQWLRTMAAAPHIAAVFSKHNIDTAALIADVEQADQP